MEWLFVVLTLGLVLTRLYLRIYRNRRWNVGDIFVVTGWLFFLIQAVLDTRLNQLGFLNPKIKPVGPDENIAEILPPHRAIQVLKVCFLPHPPILTFPLFLCRTCLRL